MAWGMLSCRRSAAHSVCSCGGRGKAHGSSMLCSQVAEQPATTAVVCVLIGTWFGLHQRQLGYPEVGLSYDRAIVQRQVLPYSLEFAEPCFVSRGSAFIPSQGVRSHIAQAWRVLTAQLSHIELLHLIFNCSSLWSLGYLERAGWRASQHTSLQYLGTSLLLLVLSGIVGFPHIACPAHNYCLNRFIQSMQWPHHHLL